jgi:hypothetical protein
MRIKDLFKKSGAKKIKVIATNTITTKLNITDNGVVNSESETLIADKGRIVGAGGNGIA